MKYGIGQAERSSKITFYSIVEVLYVGKIMAMHKKLRKKEQYLLHFNSIDITWPKNVVYTNNKTYFSTLLWQRINVRICSGAG